MYQEPAAEGRVLPVTLWSRQLFGDGLGLAVLQRPSQTGQSVATSSLCSNF